MDKTITMDLSVEEASALMQLIDAGVRHDGLRLAKAAAFFADKLGANTVKEENNDS